MGEVQGDAIRNITGSFNSLAGSVTGACSLKTTWLAVNGTGVNLRAADVEFKASNVVPTADENRPKSAVVMYCVKVVDEYKNPEQVDMANIVREIEERVRREEVQKLAGTRLWISGEYQPVLNTPTIVEHGLDIDPLRCRCEVLLRCAIESQGYKVGDTAIGWFGISFNGAGYFCHPPTPILKDKTIQFNTGSTGNGIYGFPNSNGAPGDLPLANWRYIFRIWY